MNEWPGVGFFFIFFSVHLLFLIWPGKLIPISWSIMEIHFYELFTLVNNIVLFYSIFSSLFFFLVRKMRILMATWLEGSIGPFSILERKKNVDRIRFAWCVRNEVVEDPVNKWRRSVTDWSMENQANWRLF